MKKYSEKEKNEILVRVKKGETITGISSETGIARSTIYSWLKELNFLSNSLKEKVTLRKYNELKNRLNKYQNMMYILHNSGCSVYAPLKERLAVMETLYGQYEVRTICEAFCVPRGTFYNYLFRGKHGDTANARRREDLKEAITEVFHEYHQLFGAKKITAILRQRGYIVSDKLVHKLMMESGLQSVSTSSKKYYIKWQKGENKNILQQQFYVKEPNRVWVSDITAFKFNETYYYIAAIIDLFSRKVISYRISKQNSTQLVTLAFKKAYSERNPAPGLVFHSDRGKQYMSFAFSKLLQKHNVEQSFSKSGCPHDNAVMESFFSQLKKEELYRRRYSSEKEFMNGIDLYMQFYNDRRPHRAIQYKTPNMAEENFLTLHTNSSI